MSTASFGVVLAILAFAGILACLEIGYRLARRGDEELAHEGVGAMEAAVFALLGLLLAFSFAGGTSRLEARRQLVIEEANAIGTAYLRVDLLAGADQPEIRGLFREYLEARLRMYQKLPDVVAAEVEMDRAVAIQQKLWTRVVKACQGNVPSSTTVLVLPAINSMIDVTTSRRVALYTQLPSLILVILMVVTLLSGLLAGYAMAKRRGRSWLHMFVYALVIATTIYAVIDLDSPRSGFIRLDVADNALTKLWESIR